MPLLVLTCRTDIKCSLLCGLQLRKMLTWHVDLDGAVNLLLARVLFYALDEGFHCEAKDMANVLSTRTLYPLGAAVWGVPFYSQLQCGAPGFT